MRNDIMDDRSPEKDLDNLRDFSFSVAWRRDSINNQSYGSKSIKVEATSNFHYAFFLHFLIRKR